MAFKPQTLMPVVGSEKDIDFGGPGLLLRNLWVENEPFLNAPYTLKNPPGIIADDDSVPFGISGMFQQNGVLNDQIFYASTGAGGVLYEGNGNTPVAGSAGTVETEANLETRFAGIRDFVSWVAGGSAFTYDGTVVTAVAGLPNTILDVTALGKRFVWADNTDDTVYVSDLAAGTYSGTFFTAESLSDQLSAVQAHANRLYLMGTNSIEVHAVSPDFELPFAWTGITLPFGCLGKESVATTGAHMFMVSGIDDGFGVYHFANGTPQQIAPNWLRRWIERAMQNIVDTNSVNFGGDLLDVVIHGTAFTLEGHPIYELYVPPVRLEGGTSPVDINTTVQQPGLRLWYDVSTGFWLDMTPETDFNTDDSYQQRYSAQRISDVTVGSIMISKGSATNEGGVLTTNLGRFDREAITVFDTVPQRQWCYYEPGDRISEQLDVETAMRIMQYDNTLGLKAEQYWVDMPKADVNAAGGVLYEYSDNLGVDFEAQRQLTVNYHARRGHTVIARGGKEKRHFGRIHRFSTTIEANLKIGPSMINQQLYVGG